jgi:hypothetical protein
MMMMIMVSVGRSLHHHCCILLILLLLQDCVDGQQQQASLKCATGWKTTTDLKEIPALWINDGYCDCPFDGIDEPNTDACSGSQYWPGVVASGGTTTATPLNNNNNDSSRCVKCRDTIMDRLSLVGNRIRRQY